MKYYIHKREHGRYEHATLVKNNYIIRRICLNYDTEKVTVSEYKPHELPFINNAKWQKRVHKHEFDEWYTERCFLWAL
jgi:hypothetical protein